MLKMEPSTFIVFVMVTVLSSCAASYADTFRGTVPLGPVPKGPAPKYDAVAESETVQGRTSSRITGIIKTAKLAHDFLEITAGILRALNCQPPLTESAAYFGNLGQKAVTSTTGFLSERWTRVSGIRRPRLRL